jgi:hypothetical protein
MSRPGRSLLLRAMELTHELGGRVRTDPLAYSRWTEPQALFLASRAKRKMFRTGNRGGKTWTSMADAVWRARGRHPFRPDLTEPESGWVTSVSWSQLAEGPMAVLHNMLGDRYSGPAYQPGKGYGNRSPVLRLPGGATIGFRTGDQCARRLSGAEKSWIVLDEPQTMEVYREAERRTARATGDRSISLAMTPVNAPGPLGWLEELVEAGVMEDHHHMLTTSLLTFTREVYDEGGRNRPMPPLAMRLSDGTVLDAAWIEEQRRTTLPLWAPIILDGHYRSNSEGALYKGLDPAKHLVTFENLPVDLDTGRWKLRLGVDLGSLARTQCAILVATDTTGPHPRVVILDFVESEHAGSLAEDDAKQILDMLDHWQIEWRDLESAYCDIAHQPGMGRGDPKSASKLAVELKKHMGLVTGKGRRSQPLSPRLSTVKTGQGGLGNAKRRGIELIHESTVRSDCFLVVDAPGGRRAFECLSIFEDSGPRDPGGHCADGLRYALWPVSQGWSRVTGIPKISA